MEAFVERFKHNATGMGAVITFQIVATRSSGRITPQL